MHVGLVIRGSLEDPSGGLRYGRQLIEHFRDRGDTIEVISLPRRRYTRRLADGYSRSVRRQLDRSTDILLQDERCHPALWRHNRRLRRPRRIVSLVHLLRTNTSVPRWQRPLVPRVERRYLRSVDGIVCNSAPTREAVGVLTGSPPPTIVASPGADHLPVDGSESHIIDRADREPFRVLYVGTVVRRKGLDTSIDGLAAVGADWTLTVVGDTTVEPEFTRTVRDRIRAHGLANRVAFLGRVDDETLADVLDRSHLLVMPSRYEPFGIAYLEAMAAGVVPLASTAGGATEVVTHDETGIVVPPEDPDTITLAVAQLAADRNRLRDLALAARRRYECHPTWTRSMEAVRSFCHQLLDGDDTLDAE